MTNTTKKLFWDIIRCKHLADKKLLNCQNKKCKMCCCRDIISLQKANWQCPEPWVGNLDKAYVLCLGSNPNISEDEDYPIVNYLPVILHCGVMTSWNDKETEDFFENRFKSKYVRLKNNKFNVLKHKGGKNYYGGNCKYWNKLENVYFPTIFGSVNTPSLLGNSVVLTEVVHCKSKKEEGVEKAKVHCQFHTRKILDCFISKDYPREKARTILALGKKAQDFMNDYSKTGWNVINEIPQYTTWDLCIGGAPIETNHYRRYTLQKNINDYTYTVEVIELPHPSRLL